MSDRTLSQADVEAIAEAVSEKHQQTCQVFTVGETAGLKSLAKILALAEKSAVNATVVTIIITILTAIGYGVVVMVKTAMAAIGKV